MGVGLGFGLVFVCLYIFSILCVFCSSLDFCSVFAFVVLHLVSSVLCQEVGLGERLRNGLPCVQRDVKP